MYKERIASCGHRISAALTLRGMKQSELCKLAKVPKSSLSLYLSGAYEPKQDRIYAMAKALNVSEAWLMGYDVPMEKEKSPEEPKLSEGEKMLLNLFRQVPEEKQELVLQMISVALKTKE
jgi:transcriptional regulator with XRE-family HTH domain